VTDLSQIPVYIAAVGALGLAAFGAVEAIGKTLFVFDIPGTSHTAGLPYVGYGKVHALVTRVGPALKISYGADYERTLRQQYRAGRSAGLAPETIRQGVRLGLPFLAPDEASHVIAHVWGLPKGEADRLATALTTPGSADPADQALAARFATALDTRVKAVFDLAEEVYATRAQFWAAVVAIGLSLAYEAVSVNFKWPITTAEWGGWGIALLIGLVAVPLAPAAKDLSSSISDALTALGKLRGTAK